MCLAAVWAPQGSGSATKPSGHNSFKLICLKSEGAHKSHKCTLQSTGAHKGVQTWCVQGFQSWFAQGCQPRCAQGCAQGPSPQRIFCKLPYRGSEREIMLQIHEHVAPPQDDNNCYCMFVAHGTSYRMCMYIPKYTVGSKHKFPCFVGHN